MANLLVAYRYSHYTTANYLVWALRALGHTVDCFGPGHDSSEADLSLHEALLWIEAGGGPPDWLRPYLWSSWGPMAAWFLDSHSQHHWHKDLARYFDHIFVAQRAYVDKFGRPVTWLPVACDPEIHTPPPGIEPEHDMVFVGHLYGGSPLYERRRRLLDMLGKRYNLGVYEGAYLKDMAIAHAKGRVVFNVSTSGDLNMRVFEALCSGRPLVTDWVKDAGIGELFDDEPPFHWYEDSESMMASIDYLLGLPAAARNYLGEQAREAVLARHTYRHRAQQMLEVMGLGGTT